MLEYRLRLFGKNGAALNTLFQDNSNVSVSGSKKLLTSFKTSGMSKETP